MNTVPLQKPVNQKVPLLQNQVLQKVPLQAPVPAASIKPMFAPDEAKALSAEAQAKLNSAEWLKNYRQMMEQSGPEVSDVNMRDQIAVAMRDPVYGQATATGLAAGQNMLNSWIAGANSKSRANKEKLANERWIRQMELEDEDRKLRRAELEEAKKTPVESMSFDPIYFASKEDTDKYNQMISDPMFKAQVAKNPIEAFRLLEARKAKQKQIEEFSKNVKRSVMPDRKTIDAAAKHEASKAGGGLKGLEALNSMGTTSSGNFWDRLWNDTDFQIKVADKLESQRGSRATRSFKNLAQYQNMLSKTDHMDEARMLGTLIRDQLKGADPILEVIAGEAEDSPVYIRTKGGAYVFEPTRPTELLPFVVE